MDQKYGEFLIKIVILRSFLNFRMQTKFLENQF